jgi:hypothetical protein
VLLGGLQAHRVAGKKRFESYRNFLFTNNSLHGFLVLVKNVLATPDLVVTDTAESGCESHTVLMAAVRPCLLRYYSHGHYGRLY